MLRRHHVMAKGLQAATRSTSSSSSSRHLQSMLPASSEWTQMQVRPSRGGPLQPRSLLHSSAANDFFSSSQPCGKGRPRKDQAPDYVPPPPKRPPGRPRKENPDPPPPKKSPGRKRKDGSPAQARVDGVSVGLGAEKPPKTPAELKADEIRKEASRLSSHVHEKNRIRMILHARVDREDKGHDPGDGESLDDWLFMEQMYERVKRPGRGGRKEKAAASEADDDDAACFAATEETPASPPADEAPSAKTPDKILEEADSYQEVDSRLGPFPADFVPYLRGRSSYVTEADRPLWKLLQEDPKCLDNYSPYEKQYMYSHLPPADLWTTDNIQGKRRGALGLARYFLTHRDTIKRLVDRMGLDELSAANGGKKVTILQALPGAGTITRELLTRSSVGRVVALEEQDQYRHWQESLRADPTVVDSEGVTAREKLHIINGSGYHWDVFDQVEAEGHLDHLKPVREQTTQEASGPPPPLVFMAQLPNSVLGDQFFVQMMAAAAYGGWIFKYGRVKAVCVLPETMARKSIAAPASAERHKVSVLSRIASHMKILLPNVGLQPRAAHIFPPTLRALVRSLTLGMISNENMAKAEHHVEMCAMEFVPRERQMWAWRQASGVAEDFDSLPQPPEEYNQGIATEEFESLEFLMRNLLVTRRQPLIESLERAYPGSKSILDRLTPEAVQARGGRFPSVAPFSTKWNSAVPRLYADQVEANGGDDSKPLFHPAAKLAPLPAMQVVPKDAHPIALTDEQWITLARVFERWPFRPQILNDEGRIDQLPNNRSVQD